MHVALYADGYATLKGILSAPIIINTHTRRIFNTTTIDYRLDAPNYWVFPGLINAHDHLELNHYPRTRFRDRYGNAHHWGEEVSQRLGQDPFAALQAHPITERCLIGGLKNLLAGVTTVAHHNPLHRPLRRASFPVHILRRYRWAHSLHFDTHPNIQKQLRRTPAKQPFMIHLAEGTDEIAMSEYGILRDLGGIKPNTVLIHGVGLSADNRQDAITRGAGLVWCPSTNQYLLGKTAAVDEWVTARKVALGSDSRLTADGDLLDELRAAAATRQATSETLFHMVTDWAADLLQLSGRGRLQTGMIADIIAIRRQSNDPYYDLVHTRRADIGLVIRAGHPIYGDAELINQVPIGDFARVVVDGHPKLMATFIVSQIEKSGLQEVGLQLT